LSDVKGTEDGSTGGAICNNRVNVEQYPFELFVQKRKTEKRGTDQQDEVTKKSCIQVLTETTCHTRKIKNEQYET
jgi:hypothetical protein